MQSIEHSSLSTALVVLSRRPGVFLSVMNARAGRAHSYSRRVFCDLINLSAYSGSRFGMDANVDIA